MNTQKAIAIAGLVLVGFGAVWLWRRGVAGVAEDVSSGAVALAGGAVTGVVKGAAGAAGVPDTDAAKCKRAIANGDYWDASFYCPAAEFLAAGGSAFASWFSPPERTVSSSAGVDWNKTVNF